MLGSQYQWLAIMDIHHSLIAGGGYYHQVIVGMGLDQIKGRWSRVTLRTASVPANPELGMRREKMSRSYTTKLDQLCNVSRPDP